jgi:hypothetical protein
MLTFIFQKTEITNKIKGATDKKKRKGSLPGLNISTKDLKGR